MLFGWNNSSFEGEKTITDEEAAKNIPIPTFAADRELVNALKQKVFTPEILSKLSDETLVKMFRQIEFWYTDGQLMTDGSNNYDRIVRYALSLVRQSTWYLEDMTNNNNNMTNNNNNNNKPKAIPRVRFGKTELQISIVTCGGMRLQNTWCPDNLPILAPNRKKVLRSSPQDNIKKCVRSCLALGINHFETARMYGTSEYQMVEALYELMEEGEIKREDFVFQTKLLPAATKEKFEAGWKLSWDNIRDKLGYVDLLGMHAICRLDDALMECLDVCERLKREGLVRHIGFSTHGTSEQIINIINTERVCYVENFIFIVVFLLSYTHPAVVSKREQASISYSHFLQHTHSV